jgi:Peptidase family M23
MRRRNIVAAALAALLSAGLPAIGAPIATVSGATATYYLPAPAGTKLVVTQSQNTAGDHDAAHYSQYALDFGIAGNAEFDVTASRAGKVIGLRDNSSAHCYKTTTGAIDLSCWKDANYVLVDHHDGTSALYVHLATGKAVVKIGDDVVAGQKLAVDDNTGFSSKNHLHFMVETTPTVPNTPAPGPTDKTAVAWWWTNSQPVSFSDPDVLAKAPDGIPTYGMTVTSGAPTPTTAPAVSGTWVAPKDGAKLTTSALTLSAKPTVTPPTLTVKKIAFSVSWGSTTKAACSATKAGSGGTWSCNVDLWKLGAPLGKLTLSFDVTDSAGKAWKAPAGTRAATFWARPSTPTGASFKLSGWDGLGSQGTQTVKWRPITGAGVTVRILGVTACVANPGLGGWCMRPGLSIPASKIVLIGTAPGSAGTFSWSGSTAVGPWVANDNSHWFYGVVLVAVNAAGSSPYVVAASSLRYY